MTYLERRARLALDLLGGNGIEVSRTLKFLGVRGSIQCPQYCPIAQYLEKLVGLKGVDVDRNDVHFADHERTGLLVDGNCIKTPRPVDQFIRRFDNGRIPELCS